MKRMKLIFPCLIALLSGAGCSSWHDSAPSIYIGAGAEQAVSNVKGASGSFVFVTLDSMDVERHVNLTVNGKVVRLFDFPAGDAAKFAFIVDGAGPNKLSIEAAQGKVVPALPNIEKIIPIDTALVRYEAVQEDIKSVALKQLVAQFPENPNAETEFWNRLDGQDVPLVEVLNDKDALYTFLWHGDFDTRSVELSWAVWADDRKENRLQILPGTNVWFKSVVLPVDTAMSYKLAPNVSHLMDTHPDYYRRAVGAAMQKDPLNSRYWNGEGLFKGASLLVGPKAPRPKWSVEKIGVATGHIAKLDFSSEILGNSREIFLYTPVLSAHAADIKLPLVMIFDGGRYLREAYAAHTLDNLIAQKKIPPIAAVFVSNTVPSTRGKELTCNPEYTDFLADELLPFVRKHIPGTQKSDDIITAGSSYGGLASACANLFRPDVFNSVLSQSGAYWWSPDETSPLSDGQDEGWVIRAFERTPCQGRKYYFDAGSLETGYGVESIADSSVALSTLLKAQGCEASYRTFSGGHDLYHWRETLGNGLIWLLEDQVK